MKFDIKIPVAFTDKIVSGYTDNDKIVQYLRGERGKKMPAWKNWCFLPLSLWQFMAMAEDSKNYPRKAIELAAAATWRYTKGIFIPDKDLLKSVINTKLLEIPSKVLVRLPNWCVYVPLPAFIGEISPWQQVQGFFAHAEDYQEGEKVFLIVQYWTTEKTGDRLIPFTLELSDTVANDLSATQVYATDSELIKYCINILLYLCSFSDDIWQGERPSNPNPKRTNDGFRLFLADKTTFHQVGLSDGEKIRQRNCGTVTGNWQGDWITNRKGEKRFIYKWIF